MKTAKTLTCQQCKAEWVPRKKQPIQCPRCKSLRWNEKGDAQSNYQEKLVKKGWSEQEARKMAQEYRA